MKKNSTINEINVNDVLLGRGGKINANAGNVQFRELVKAHKDAYLSAKRYQKGNVAQMVVNRIKSLDPPGRFLEECEEIENSWIEVSIERVLKKTKQALRELDDSDIVAERGSIPFPPPTYYPNRNPRLQQSTPVDYNIQRSLPVASTLSRSISYGDPRSFAASMVGGGDSSYSSTDTASTVPLMNNRRRYFSQMKNEASIESSISKPGTPLNLNQDTPSTFSQGASLSLNQDAAPLQFNENDRSKDFNEDEIMRESFHSISEKQSSGDVSISKEE